MTSFFIPACDHGFCLARTFIIGGMGYDLFPMSSFEKRANQIEEYIVH